MPHTLLLADDSVTIQRVIELTFADEDVTVVAVSDGDQAIAHLEMSPPDIVLADIGMPGKNGYEVAQYVRRSPRLAHIPVVLLTGAFEPVDQARADDAGCDGVLAKPFEPQMVIGRVKELLARPHGGQAARDAQRRTDAAESEPGVPAAPAQAVSAATYNWGLPAQDAAAASAPVAPMVEAQQDQLPPGQLTDYFDRLGAAFSKTPAQPDEVAGAVKPQPDLSAAASSNPLDWFAAPAPPGGAGEPWDLPAPPADVAPPDLPLASTSLQPELSIVPAPPESVVAAVSRVEPAAEPAPSTAHESIAAPDERLAPIEESAPVGSIEEPPTAAEPSAAVAPPAPSARPLDLPLANVPPLPPLADAFAALLAAEQGAPLPTGALWLTGPPPPPAPAVVSDDTIEAITRRVLDRLSETVVRQAVADVASTVAERLIREEIERIKANLQ